ncbi:hypothetical protein, partial [Chromatium okenii]|uniref:hypothetical protein n=1 Tax=Chromatium okenii TaxID=61644 RepID=UPI0026EBF818
MRKFLVARKSEGEKGIGTKSRVRSQRIFPCRPPHSQFNQGYCLSDCETIAQTSGLEENFIKFKPLKMMCVGLSSGQKQKKTDFYQKVG